MSWLQQRFLDEICVRIDLNYLIGSETVMELHDPYFITALTFVESCLLENFVCACLAHLVPNQVHSTLSFKGVHSVSGKGLSHDLNGLVLQCMRMNKIFRNDNATRSTILRMVGWAEHTRSYQRTHRCRTTHEFSEIFCDFRRSQDLVDGPSITELWIRVSHRMFVVLRGYFESKISRFRRIQITSVPILARCSTPPPNFEKYSWAPLSNKRGAPGPWFLPRATSSSAERWWKRIVGGARSGKLVPRLPGFMRSKPRARAHSTWPYLTALLAW